MKPTFWEYIREAFKARPASLFVPPNWIGLGVFGFLGILTLLFLHHINPLHYP